MGETRGPTLVESYQILVNMFTVTVGDQRSFKILVNIGLKFIHKLYIHNISIKIEN